MKLFQSAIECLALCYFKYKIIAFSLPGHSVFFGDKTSVGISTVYVSWIRLTTMANKKMA